MIEEYCKCKYSISPKIGHILLHWKYESTKKDFFNEFTSYLIKMSYYWFHKQEILQKAKKNIPKKKLLSIMLKTKKL